MTRGDLEKMLRTPPTMRGVLVASAVTSIVWHAVAGDPWAQLPIQLVLACAIGVLLCWGWQRLARM